MATKNFQMTNAEVKKASTKEVVTFNTNPTYLMRKLNKVATGKDTDTKEVEGFSREALKELYDRLNEAYNCGGFWWGSIIARQGYCITAAREVNFLEGDENNTDAKGMYDNSGRIHTEKINGTLYSLREAATWSYTNIIASASLNLRFAEAAAKKSGNLYSWQVAQEAAKKKAKDAKKEERKQQRKAEAAAKKKEEERMQAFIKRAKELKFQIEKGTINEEEAAQMLLSA